MILHSKFSLLQGQDYCVQGVVPWQRLSGWMHNLGLPLYCAQLLGVRDLARNCWLTYNMLVKNIYLSRAIENTS